MLPVRFLSALSLTLLYFHPTRVVGSHVGKCGGKQVDFSEKDLNELEECLKVVGAATMHDLGIDNGACFFKCTMEKKGIIDAKAVIHKDKVDGMLNVAIPDKVKAAIKEGLLKCFDEESEGIKMTGDDGTCSSLMPLVMCVHMTFLENC